MADVVLLGMELDKDPPPVPSQVFHSSIAAYWESICEYSPSQDESSTEIWNGIKWSLSMNITTLTQFYDSVTITGKYQYDESWTEAFATFKNAEQWKKNVTDNIHSTASKNYKVKIDIGGTRRLPAKGDATIIITITWNPPATA
jgi:hypothetical protein